MATTLACVENIPRAITFLERSDADAEILRASFLCIKLCARLDNVVDGAAADSCGAGPVLAAAERQG